MRNCCLCKLFFMWRWVEVEHWKAQILGKNENFWISFTYEVLETFKRHESQGFKRSLLSSSGQVSAKGILHLMNPNLGSKIGMQIFEPRILGPNSGVEKMLALCFPIKRAPSKIHPQELTAQNSHQAKIHPRIRLTIHVALLQGYISAETSRALKSPRKLFLRV